MPSEIKAIIFDYGNVLCEPQLWSEVVPIAQVLGLPASDFEAIYWRDRVAYDRDDMSPAEYWNTVAGRQLEAAAIDKAVDLDNKSWLHPRQKTIRWVDAASRQGLRTALLSNLPVPLRDALEKDCPWLPRFDVRTYSCTLRKTKPQPGIYEACVSALGLKPREIVFLDDRPENIVGALKLGIHAIQFETAEQAALDLEAQFGLSLGQDA